MDNINENDDSTSSEYNEIEECNELEEYSSILNDISLYLAKNVFQTESNNKNFVFSPLSIQVVIGLIAAGSKGLTQSKLLSVYKSDSIESLTKILSQLVTQVFVDVSSSGGPCLAYANGVWFDHSMTLKHSFKEVVQDLYKAALNQIDIKYKPEEARVEVNLWGERETRGHIKEILPDGSVESETQAIFGNALYFKGEWKEKFDVSKTKDHEFYLLNGSTVKTPFLTSKNIQYVSRYEDFKVCSLPYQYDTQNDDCRRFSMCFFLPHAKDGLPALVDKISSEQGFLESHIPYRREEVGNFLIPKFEIRFGFQAADVLERLGLVMEGLSEIATTEDVLFTHVFHKSFIQVNEEGTEAAACTVATRISGAIGGRRSRPLPIDFVADHPFLFLIREEASGVVVFIGAVLEPNVVGSVK